MVSSEAYIDVKKCGEMSGIRVLSEFSPSLSEIPGQKLNVGQPSTKRSIKKSISMVAAASCRLQRSCVPGSALA